MMGWAMTAGGRVGNAIRGVVVPRLHFVPGLRSRTVTSKTPSLDRSALVVKAFRLRQLAGALCPNPVLPGGARLDTVLGNGFALISTEPLSRKQREQLRQRGAVEVMASAETELGRWLRRGGAKAVIIRPDRTVMQAGRRVSPVCDGLPSLPVTTGGSSQCDPR